MYIHICSISWHSRTPSPESSATIPLRAKHRLGAFGKRSVERMTMAFIYLNT